MVVGKHNYDEVFDMIEFCKELGCDLKILGIVSVPVSILFGKRGDYFQEVTSLEKKLKDNCEGIYSHEYTRGFGIPCFRYKFGNTYVTIKNSSKGSHYDREKDGICSKCKYFPCHEGLYNLFALPDGRLWYCRKSENQKYEDREELMKYLISAFRRATYIPQKDNADMDTLLELKKEDI